MVKPGLPKLIATDLDGTLVRSDDTVVRLHPRGARPGAGGRHPDRRRHRRGPRARLADGQPADRPPRAGRCCAKGAMVYDLHTEQVVERSLLAAGRRRGGRGAAEAMAEHRLRCRGAGARRFPALGRLRPDLALPGQRSSAGLGPSA